MQFGFELVISNLIKSSDLNAELKYKDLKFKYIIRYILKISDIAFLIQKKAFTLAKILFSKFNFFLDFCI